MYYINDKRATRAFTTGATYWNCYRRLSEQQNLLIAGTTGSGKSTVLQGILHAICASESACAVELWLADPKRVDLIEWLDMGTPQLARYANTTDEIKQMVSDLVRVMESRFRWMEDHRVKQYPGKTIYLVVDELGDLVMNDKRIVDSLKRILQLGRAAGIRSILCTQSPSRQTLPAVLQVNFTARLALRCVSAIESRQVLNAAGAENLPRYGKGICLTPDTGMFTVDLPLQDMDDTRRMVKIAIDSTEY
ncbi:MAG: DNA translocase FtsK [Spirochaetales bacterium]|nr:DNA translocase FtsK [Spirochaetales bacterium]